MNEPTYLLTKSQLLGLVGSSYALTLAKSESVSAVALLCSGVEAAARELDVLRHAADTDESEDLDMVLWELANRLRAVADVAWSISRQPAKATPTLDAQEGSAES